jgi:hypothetical protein
MTTKSALTGNLNPYSQIYYGGINYSKIKKGKLVYVMDHLPP